ncbi:MAG: hypothetical protein C7B45_03790 [Sulfobacillus acidophilus]|uniref:Uncharacterized protein n=1 Tax=Sulfobacillus acidophilus TaxID=53633 RepID=A0A2T2WLW6_9FIRM|nr:MAG: hypothetical protein C7B45_03790 [Sulfobacillus acidophilus]
MPFGIGNSGNQVSDMKDVESQLQALMAKTSKGAATSNLSALDFWLVTDAGYEPLGLVLGNSVMSMGISGGIATAFKGMQRGELTQLTQLMYDARELALQRMKSEASDLGADAIVNVNLEIIHRSEEVMEVVATGTAVRKVGERSNRPVTLQVR